MNLSIFVHFFQAEGVRTHTQSGENFGVRSGFGGAAFGRNRSNRRPIACNQFLYFKYIAVDFGNRFPIQRDIAVLGFCGESSELNR